MASGGAPSGLRQRQVVPELSAGADAELGDTLGKGYSPSGPQVLARFRLPPLVAQPFAVYQVGMGEMDGDAAVPEAVDRLPALSVSAVGAWMPSIHSGGCDRRAGRRWLRQCLRDPPGIPTDAILARKRDGGAIGQQNAGFTQERKHSCHSVAWRQFPSGRTGGPRRR